MIESNDALMDDNDAYTTAMMLLSSYFYNSIFQSRAAMKLIALQIWKIYEHRRLRIRTIMTALIACSIAS
jgi:hypothetical protein